MSINNPKVSIITAVYNTPSEYLKECFDSVMQQSFTDLEFIVIDDGSDKKTADFCDSYSNSKDSHIEMKVIHNVNHGVAYSRNCGLDTATGEYIVFVDSDDKIGKNFVSLMLRTLNEFDCKLVVCDYSIEQLENDTASIEYDSKADLYVGNDIYLNINTRYIWRTIYSAEILKNIRFKENLSAGEDIDFFNRVIDKCGSVGCLHKKLYYYRQNPASLTHNFSEKICKDALGVYERVYINSKKLTALPDVYTEYFTGYARWIMRYVTAVRNQKNYSKFVEAKKFCVSKTKNKIHYIEKKNIKIMIMLSRMPSLVYYAIIKAYEALRVISLRKRIK